MEPTIYFYSHFPQSLELRKYLRLIFKQSAPQECTKAVQTRKPLFNETSRTELQAKKNLPEGGFFITNPYYTE
jgi:hypothetical protein